MSLDDLAERVNAHQVAMDEAWAAEKRLARVALLRSEILALDSIERDMLWQELRDVLCLHCGGDRPCYCQRDE